jgi:hypothetical protein
MVLYIINVGIRSFKIGLCINEVPTLGGY